MYLYRGKVYRENQFRELMTLIKTEIRNEPGHHDVGEQYGRLFGAKDAYQATRHKDHMINSGIAYVLNNRLRNRDQQPAPAPAPEVVVSDQRRRQKPAGPLSERIIVRDAVELDRARMARRKRSQLEDPIDR